MIDLSQLVVALDTQRQGSMVLIRPHLDYREPLTLRYRLTVSQHSSAGTASIRQDGELSTSGSAGSVQLSMPAQAQCRLQLELFDAEQRIKMLEQGC